MVSLRAVSKQIFDAKECFVLDGVDYKLLELL